MTSRWNLLVDWRTARSCRQRSRRGCSVRLPRPTIRPWLPTLNDRLLLFRRRWIGRRQNAADASDGRLRVAERLRRHVHASRCVQQSFLPYSRPVVKRPNPQCTRAAFQHTHSRSAYHYNAETQVFHQPYLSSELLGRLVGIESNRRLLAKVALAKDYSYKPDLPAGTGGRMSTPITIETVGQKGKQNTLADLAALGAANQDIGVAVFEDVLDILARQSTCVIFARRHSRCPADNLNASASPSSSRSMSPRPTLRSQTT